MSNRNNTRLEIGNEFEIQIPGPVPKEPKHSQKFDCDCDHCLAYKGTYTFNTDSDDFGTAELIQ